MSDNIHHNNDKPLMIGLDLGNTNTSLAYRVSAGKIQLLPIDDDTEKPNSLRHVLRSAVFFRSGGDSDVVVGRRATMLSTQEGWLFTDFKSALLTGETAPATRQGLTKSPIDAQVEVLRDLRNRLGKVEASCFEIENQNGRHEAVPLVPPLMTLGVPSETLDSYKGLLKKALVKSSWFSTPELAETNVSFLPEPIAPLLLLNEDGEKTYLVFDAGGLTLDFAVARSSADSEYRYDILASHRCRHEGRDIGGTLLDQLLIKSYAISDDNEALLELAEKLEEAYGKPIDPERFYSLCSDTSTWIEDGSNEAESYKFLKIDVENLRIALSEKDSRLLVLNSSSADTLDRLPVGERLDRRDFDEKILEDVLGSVETGLDQILSVGDERVNKKDVSCIAVGGVSKTPGIVAYLRTSFGAPNIRPTGDYSPLEAIAAGCVHFTPAMPQEPLPLNTRTETDYGVWATNHQRWSVIVPEGTEFSLTQMPDGRLPREGEGISKTYRTTHPGRFLKIRVGQRAKHDQKWVLLGERMIPVEKSLKEFRVYFQINYQQGNLEIYLLDYKNAKLISVKDAKFSIID